MRQNLLALAFTLASFALTAQISFTSFPEDFQLVPRESDARTAVYRVRGTVTGAATGRRLSAKLTQAGRPIDSSAIDLAYANGVATFDLAIAIPVTRANHTLQVTLDGAPVATANYLVAGDVYLVNGQSNAEALVAMREADRDSFLRGPRYLATGWAPMQFARVGLWMGRAANELSKRRDVPVAAFNFAVGAQSIQFFRKGHLAKDGNFEAGLDTLRKYGVMGKARGFIWFQGEADAFTYSAERYRRELSGLLDEYGAAYGVPRFYAFQTRTFSCSGRDPGVMEGQRQLSAERADFDLMSTMNATHSADGCHYVAEGGYDLLGTRMANVILYRESGGAGSPRVLPPDVVKASITGPREISVWFETHGAGLAVTGNPYPEFRAEGVDLRPTGGRVDGDRVVLTFDADVSAATGITYLSHAGTAPDYAYSKAGPGVLTFSDYSFIPGDGDLGNYADARLTLASAQASIKDNDILEVNMVLYNEGQSTLRLAEVATVPPSGLNFTGIPPGAPGTIDFDGTRIVWRLPRLAPGDSAVMPLRFYVNVASAPTIWAQVTSVESRDEDSTPGNGTAGVVAEDDEARIVIGDRSKDCVLSVEATAVSCQFSARDSVLLFSLSARDATPSTLTTAGEGVTATTWAPGTRLELSVKDYRPLLTQLDRFPLKVVKAADATCATVATVKLPDSCAKPTAIDPAPAVAVLRLYPNPIRSGELVRVDITEAPGFTPADVMIWSVTGQRMSVGEVYREGETTVALRAQLPAGVYVVAVGRARQLLTVVE